MKDKPITIIPLEELMTFNVGEVQEFGDKPTESGEIQATGWPEAAQIYAETLKTIGENGVLVAVNADGGNVWGYYKLYAL